MLKSHRSFVCSVLILFWSLAALASGDFSPAGSMTTPRTGHIATLLPNGGVLLAGGSDGVQTLATAEVYDAVRATFSLTGAMTTPRRRFTATALPNGKVLVVGGLNGSDPTAGAELYDPATGTFTTTGSLSVPRADHTATLLANGKVLIAGGTSGTSVTATLEIYDPATGFFSPAAASLSSPRAEHTATLHTDGRVFLLGGTDGSAILSSGDVFNPATGAMVSTSAMSSPRKNHIAFLRNGVIFALGGTSDGANALATVDQLQPNTNQFFWVSTLATPRTGMAAAQLPNGWFLVAGGSNGTSALSNGTLWNVADQGLCCDMSVPRLGHTATLLADGRVLLAGGDNGAGAVTATADLHRFSATQSYGRTYLSVPREIPSATLLPDGRILVAGGTNGFTTYLDTAEIIGGPAGTRLMTVARANHTATLLRNGKVFLAGGYTGNRYSASTEFFDPVTNAFTPGPDMLQDRGAHRAVLLGDGRVLLAGGYSTSLGGYTATAEVYDPVSNGFTAVSNEMSHARLNFAMALLDDRRVLLGGGVSWQSGYYYPTSADIYDPITNRFTRTGDLNVGRSRSGTTILPNGKVLVAGGENFNASCLGTAELFDPATETFSTVAMRACRSELTATLLPDGRALIAGGSQNGSIRLSSSELYDPSANGFTLVTAAMGTAHSRHAAVQDAGGRALIIGGQNGSFQPQTSIDIFNPGNVADGRRPLLSAAPATLDLPGRIIVTGSGFRSDNEGAGGTTQQSASDRPLVLLQHVDGGQLVHAAADSWSQTSVSAPIADLPAGQYRVSVITAGAASTQKVMSAGCPAIAPASALSAFAAAPSRNDLQWTPSPATIDHYNVYRAAGACGVGAFTKIGEATSTSYEDSAVSPGMVYAYVVTAESAGDVCSSPPTSCADTGSVPVPTVEASGPTTFCAGGSVTLTSSAAAGNVWSTGATTQSIVVTASGAYSVTVSDANGHSATSTPLTVSVLNPATPTITPGGPTSFCPGGSVVLTSSPAVSYLWSNGVTAQSIVVAEGGTYAVTATDENGCSATSAPVTVTVNPAPDAPSVTASGPTTFCEGDSVTLRAPDGYSYLWSTGATTQSIVVSVSGSYSVTTTNASGCAATSAPVDVTASAVPEIPLIAASGPTAFCEGGSVTLTAPAGYSYLWSTGATTQSIVVSATGSYAVTTTNGSGCAATSAPVAVTTNALPEVPVIAASGPTTFCEGGSVMLTAPAGYSYLWSTGATTQSIVVSATGSYAVTTTNGSGCGATSAPVDVTASAVPEIPLIAASGPTTFCEGGSVMLTAPAGYSYLWSNGATTQSIVASASGSYSVTTTNGSGCAATSAPVAVATNAPPEVPVIVASGPTTFCEGGSVMLTAPAGYSYLWSTGATTQSIVVSASGSYAVTTTNGSGCAATSAPVAVTANALPEVPVITASGPTSFCEGGSVTLTAPAGYSYLWSTGATTQSIVVSATGIYAVTTTNGSGCAATSAPATVTVTPPTTITSQPASRTIAKNQSATLTVVAAGTGPLSYQWYEGASGDTTRPIAGATASSWTTPLLRKGTYRYWAGVSGSCGTVASATATIEAN